MSTGERSKRLIWSLRDSPVSRSVMQGRDLGKGTYGGYGPLWSSAFARYNPDWPLLKMSQDSCDPWLAGQASLLSESSSLTWPNSGMTLDGVAYGLPMLELLISDRVSSSLPGEGLLPNPSANDRTGAESAQDRNDRRAGGHSLRDLPRLLPTPAAEEARGTAEQRLARKKKADGWDRNTVTSLGILVKTLPTPTAGDARSSGSRNLEGSKANEGVSLTDIVRTGDSSTPRLPTPTTQDAHNNAGPSQRARNSDPLNVAVAKMLPSPTVHVSGRGKGSAERYRGPKSQGSRRSNIEDALEAVKEGSPWVQEGWTGESSDQPSSNGSGSPEVHPAQSTIWDD